jgi:hypothetical protein
MRELKFDLSVAANALLCPNPQEFYSKAYISEDIVNNFRTLPGIKSATKVANVLFDDILKASACNFTAGTQDLDALDIDVCALSAMAELCRFDLEQSFISLQMAAGSNSSFEVPSFMAYYWDEMAKEVGEEIAILRWQGNTGGAQGNFLDLCDGYELKLGADINVVDVSATASITTANVLGEMLAVYSAAPTSIQNKIGDLRFYVSSDIATAFRFAVASGNTLAYVTKDLDLTFLGIKIVVQEGLSAKKMVLTLKDNMIYAFDGEGDGKELKAVNMEDTVAEPLLRTRANLKVGFHFTNPTEIVYYS